MVKKRKKKYRADMAKRLYRSPTPSSGKGHSPAGYVVEGLFFPERGKEHKPLSARGREEQKKEKTSAEGGDPEANHPRERQQGNVGVEEESHDLRHCCQEHSRSVEQDREKGTCTRKRSILVGAAAWPCASRCCAMERPHTLSKRVVMRPLCTPSQGTQSSFQGEYPSSHSPQRTLELCEEVDWRKNKRDTARG